MRIREALLQLAASTSLEINATEFGTVLNSLIQEYQQRNEEDRFGPSPYLEQAAEILFPGFRLADWAQVEYYVRDSLRYEAAHTVVLRCGLCPALQPRSSSPSTIASCRSRRMCAMPYRKGIT